MRGASLSETDLGDADINGAKIQYTKIDGARTGNARGFVESCSGAYILTQPNNIQPDMIDKNGTRCMTVNREDFYTNHYGNYRNEQELFLCRLMEAGSVADGFGSTHRGLVDTIRCNLD